MYRKGSTWTLTCLSILWVLDAYVAKGESGFTCEVIQKIKRLTLLDITKHGPLIVPENIYSHSWYLECSMFM